MYLTYFLSLYPFAVPRPDFLYKTASLQWVGGGGGHQFSRRKQILVDVVFGIWTISFIMIRFPGGRMQIRIS